MALFGKSSAKQSNGAVKHRSTIGFLLNPDIGASISPMRDTVRMFVNLLAMIFVASGMFPRNHPAFKDESIHLGLPEVMGTAWKSLKPTPGNLPRYLLFFGVLSALIFCGVAIFVIVASTLIGHAHADTTPTTTTGTGSNNSFFSPVDSTQDIAIAWINFLFKGQPVYNYLSGCGQVLPQLTSVQSALMKILGFYSDAILVVAAFMLFYYLTTMIISTAQHGEIMGKKADKVWAPIRLVIALGLLVPVSGGLSAGQSIVIQFVEWGSNLASQTWSLFLNNVTQTNQDVANAVAPDSSRVVYDTIMSEACVEAYQAYMNGWSGGGGAASTNGTDTECPGTAAYLTGGQYNISWKASNLPSASAGGTGSVNNQAQMTSNGGSPQILAMCGGYLYKAVDGSDKIGQSIAQVRQTAFESTLRPAVQSFVKANLQYFICNGVGGSQGQTLPTNNLSDDISNQLIIPYENAIASAYQSSVMNGSAANSENSCASQSGSAATGSSTGGGTTASGMQQVAGLSSAQGWVSAGAWLNTIARLQGEYARVDEALPGTQPPDFTEAHDNDAMYKDHIKPALMGFENQLNAVMPRSGSVTTSGDTSSTNVTMFSMERQGIVEEEGAGGQDRLDRLFAIVDWIAGKYGVWNPVLSTSGDTPDLGAKSFGAAKLSIAKGNVLGIQFTSANPLAQMTAFGHSNLNTAYKVFDVMFYMQAYVGMVASLGKNALGLVAYMTQKVPGIGGALSLLPGLGEKAGGAIQQLIAGVLPILATVSLVFFTAGFMLAYFLPLIPFLRFFFNTITWFIALLEAIVSVPLIALAHLNPEGEGLPGSAKAAYGMILSIFLRPVMMVFGLILGLMVFSIAAGLLNLMYALAVVGTGGVAHTAHIFLSRLIYSIIYVFMLYMAGNSCFKMIEYLPEQAVDWMGLRGMQFRNFGDPGDIQQPMQFVSSYADQQLMQGVQRLPGAAAYGIDKFMGGANTPEKLGAAVSKDVIDVARTLGGAPAAQMVQQFLDKFGGVTYEAEAAAGKLPADNPIRKAATQAGLIDAAGNPTMAKPADPAKQKPGSTPKIAPPKQN